MPVSALIDPSNRLLGWSTNDLSLYGGQPTVSIGAPAGSANDGLTAPADDKGDDAPAGNTASNLQPLAPSDSSLSSTETSAGTDPASLVSGLPLTSPSTTSQGVSAPSVDAPAPSIGAQPVMSGLAMPPHPEAAASHSGAGSLNPSDIAPVGSAVSPLTAQTVHLPDSLAAHVDHATDALSTITTTLGTTLDPIINTLDRIGDDGLGLLTGDHGALSLTGLTGTDPAAGIVTLTSMLDSVDAFAVAPEGGSSALFASTGPVLDLLADDAPHALLGDIAHHEDGLLPLDHHDGGLGLL